MQSVTKILLIIPVLSICYCKPKAANSNRADTVSQVVQNNPVSGNSESPPEKPTATPTSEVGLPDLGITSPACVDGSSGYSTINQIQTVGDITYLAGEFMTLGRCSFGSLVDSLTGATIENSMPQFTGAVTAATSDGSGGWFVAGNFGIKGVNLQSNIYHIRSDGSVDTNFVVRALDIKSLAVAGSNLIIAGTIYHPNGFGSASKLGAVKTLDASPVAWFPNPNYAITKIVVSDTKIFVSGTFQSISSQSRSNVASFNISDLSLTSWNPTLSSSDYISDISLHQQKLYLGGKFSVISGQNRTNLASYSISSDNSSDVLTSWSPNAPEGIVALTNVEDTTFVADSATVGLYLQSTIFAFDSNSGQLKSTTFGLEEKVRVKSMTPFGSKFYVLGSKSVGNDFIGYSTSFEKSGKKIEWNASPSRPESFMTVNGDKLFVGGVGLSLNARLRRNLAAIDSRGRGLPWNSNVNGPVYAMNIIDSTIYIGGRFSDVAGYTRNNFAAVAAEDGTVKPLNVQTNGKISAMIIKDSDIYIAGDFTSVGSSARGGLAKLKLATGEVYSLNHQFGTVSSMSIFENTLYLSGNFTNVSGNPRGYGASINLTDNSLTSWNPSADVRIFKIEASKDFVYLLGYFDALSSVAAPGFGIVHPQTGAFISLAPDITTMISSMFVLDKTLYYGGKSNSQTLGNNPGKIMNLDTQTNAAGNLALSYYKPPQNMYVSGNLVFFSYAITNNDNYYGVPMPIRNPVVIDKNTGQLLW